MGPRNSKEDTAKKEVVVTDSSSKVVENSSGFHMIEIHMPSMGMGLLIVGIGVCIFLAYRWRKRNRRLRRDCHMRYPVMTAMPPVPWSSSTPYGYRFSPYPPGRIEELVTPDERPPPQGLPRPDNNHECDGPPGPAMARM